MTPRNGRKVRPPRSRQDARRWRYLGNTIVLVTALTAALFVIWTVTS